MVFENSQIETSQLPALQEVNFQRLAPASRSVEYITTALASTVVLILAIVVFFSVPSELWWVKLGTFVLWALIFAGGMFFAGKQYEMAGYALREHDVVHKHGVWWQTVTTVPFNRMQHCEISQGPVESLFGLATLRVFTAGGTSSDLAIDGLPHEEALRIKDFITKEILGGGSGSGSSSSSSSSSGSSSRNPELASGGSGSEGAGNGDGEAFLPKPNIDTLPPND